MATVRPKGPRVYIADDSTEVREEVSDKLRAAGAEVYFPAAVADPDNPTQQIGGFRCALMNLERTDGTIDAVDTAEIMNMYQPNLPFGFLYQHAGGLLLQRARSMGPTFHKPEELWQALLWVQQYTKA